MYLPINSEYPNINFVTCILCYSKYEFITMNTMWAQKDTKIQHITEILYC